MPPLIAYSCIRMPLVCLLRRRASCAIMQFRMQTRHQPLMIVDDGTSANSHLFHAIPCCPASSFPCPICRMLLQPWTERSSFPVCCAICLHHPGVPTLLGPMVLPYIPCRRTLDVQMNVGTDFMPPHHAIPSFYVEDLQDQAYSDTPLHQHHGHVHQV